MLGTTLRKRRRVKRVTEICERARAQGRWDVKTLRTQLETRPIPDTALDDARWWLKELWNAE